MGGNKANYSIDSNWVNHKSLSVEPGKRPIGSKSKPQRSDQREKTKLNHFPFLESETHNQTHGWVIMIEKYLIRLDTNKFKAHFDSCTNLHIRSRLVGCLW